MTDSALPGLFPATGPPFHTAVPGVLRLDADLHTSPGTVQGRSGLAAALARAAASGLRELGVTAPARPEPGWTDAYVAAVRAAGALSPTRIHCGLQLGVLGTAGRLDLPRETRSRLSHVDYVVLVPGPGADWHRRSGRPEAERVVEDVLLASLRAAATLPVPVVLAAPFAVLPGLGLDERDVPDEAVGELGWACARAGVAIEVTERWRTPSARVARLLAGAGVTLTAGSAARSAADIGRWSYVRAVATALDGTDADAAPAAPVPHPHGTRPRTRRP